MNSTFFTPRADFGDTLTLPSRLPSRLTSHLASLGVKNRETRGDTDPLEEMALTDRADWALLRLVLCATLATLVLALASALHV